MKNLVAVSAMLLIAVMTPTLTSGESGVQVEQVVEATAPAAEDPVEEIPIFIEPDPVEEIAVASVQNDPIQAIDQEELEMLACVIYQEAGGDAVSDEARYMVGDVVLNRVADDRFPNTIEEVLTQKNQYGRFYWTGIIWPKRAQNPGEANAVNRAYQTARDLLSDTYHSRLYNEGYIWQAGFRQGSDIVVIDGIYFGK